MLAARTLVSEAERAALDEAERLLAEARRRHDEATAEATAIVEGARAAVRRSDDAGVVSRASEEAARIVADARRAAEDLLARARGERGDGGRDEHEARSLVEQARREAEALVAAARAASDDLIAETSKRVDELLTACDVELDARREALEIELEHRRVELEHRATVDVEQRVLPQVVEARDAIDRVLGALGQVGADDAVAGRSSDTELAGS
jgi:vacuolar-type H+-ATPase subunit H